MNELLLKDVIKSIASKLYAEGYDYDDETTMKKITDIVDDIDLDEIIDVIASQDISKTSQYVKKLWTFVWTIEYIFSILL